MATLFLGVRITQRAYEFLPIENINLNNSVDYLKDEISKKINYPKDEIQLVYCGNVLDKNQNILNDYKITPNTTIHVFKKTQKPQITISTSTYTDEECQKIADIFGTVTGTQLSVTTRMNILSKIVDEYPEFVRNLGAQALIRDSVLFHSLDKVEVIKKIARNYSVICDAADFIVKTTKKELTKDQNDTFSEELFSSSSSEEENSLHPNNQSERARIRRISRDQLTQALLLAGTASSNSLSNIAQRNSNLAQERQQSSAPSATTSTPGRITSSLFNNALTQALMSAASNQTQQSRLPSNQDNAMDTTESILQSQSNLNNQNNDRVRYANQLQLMREMGLVDEITNLQALILSNGEVESAVNLVLGGMSNLLN